MITASGTLYLSKTSPLATRALDGTFALTLLAFDRLGVHQVEPWRITWSGPGAFRFWTTHGHHSLKPGQPIEVQLERIRTFTSGKWATPESHAVATSIQLAPLAHVTTHHHQEPATPCPQSH